LPIISQGPTLTQDITFNSGTLDINASTLAALSDVSINATVSLKEIRALGTIKMLTAPKRYGYKVEVKAKTRSINQALYAFMFGYSTPDSGGFDYSIFDGQNVLSDCTINCIMNEDVTKTVQFQLKDAVISATNLNLVMEDSGVIDISIMASDVKVVTNFAD
jgi:hypothetical protein